MYILLHLDESKCLDDKVLSIVVLFSLVTLIFMCLPSVAYLIRCPFLGNSVKLCIFIMQVESKSL
jgi:hypothetical protein